ncbi:L,D-peptidoglycan transpeptidase YkuD (ErfK/YbiS/YcfS/YnhG family) [Ancylobacter aquaticus]|uniref:L,D-peptidoglycan transpeptidase YkuD (ErfK/YbiS/YcfS/YnhG family) n=2 Tax=Ancylobacter aquaticus TaxID=100 RepID=A0A4R1IAC5_ANCAQ|nr:L,D-peptidoglycan transpeptidase YkuD (ErfK/YbiS/YcfS/YnhG family) [Ancylobacter aquaticus]
MPYVPSRQAKGIRQALRPCETKVLPLRDVIVNGNGVKKKTLRTETHGKSRFASRLRVVLRPAGQARQHGWLILDGRAVPVALGRAGIRADKREGDGATPRGIWHAREVRYRADRVPRPITGLPALRTRRGDGWCDDPRDGRYNCLVRLPVGASHEEMWREDGLYDLVVVLDYNSCPRRAWRGSAVFMHIARGAFEPTAGCVAFRPADLRRLLARLNQATVIEII